MHAHSNVLKVNHAHVLQHATTEDGGLELYPQAGVANIGIMLFRSGAKAFAEVCLQHGILC